MIDIENRYVKLTKSEARRLHNLLRERHGNTKACSEKTGLSINTLKRAKECLEITPDNARVIRLKLFNKEQVEGLV